MVGAAAVVFDSPAEFGEHKHGDVVFAPVFAEVVVEVANRARHFVPQLGVADYLAGVGVEAAVLGVEDARPEVGEQRLRHALEALRYRVGGVFDAGCVLLRGGTQNVRALERVRARLPQKVHHLIAPLRAAVHLGERLERVLPHELVLNVGEQPVGLEVADGRHGDAADAERARQPATEVDGGQDVVAVRIQLARRQPKPAFAPNVVGQRRVPYVHRAEVRAVRVRVADAVDHRHLPLVPQPLDRPHAGVEGEAVPDGVNLVEVEPDGLPIVEVEAVVVRRHRVERVVAARQLEYDQRPVVVVAILISH